jgi:enoyl-CoA hydratase
MIVQPIKYLVKDQIAHITIDRPDSGNRLTAEMAQDICEIACRINQDQNVHAAIISGAGKESFCSGDEFDLHLKAGDSAELTSMCKAARAIAEINCPAIAAINGDALGEGLELALSCDIRIASETARFGLPQIRAGLIPMDGGTQRLPRIVGKGKALEMVLTGDIISAQVSLEIGLVNKIVSPGNLLAEVESLASNLAAKAPIAVKYIKEAVNKGMDLSLEQGLRMEGDLYFLLHTTADRTEGIRSFLQKRKPHYEGK